MSTPNPTMIINCDVNYQPDGKVNIITVWTLSDTPGLLEAIDEFTILPHQIDTESHTDGGVMERYSKISVKPNVRFSELIFCCNYNHNYN